MWSKIIVPQSKINYLYLNDIGETLFKVTKELKSIKEVIMRHKRDDPFNLNDEKKKRPTENKNTSQENVQKKTQKENQIDKKKTIHWEEKKGVIKYTLVKNIH